jgi:hypothetical protein
MLTTAFLEIYGSVDDLSLSKIQLLPCLMMLAKHSKYSPKSLASYAVIDCHCDTCQGLGV